MTEVPAMWNRYVLNLSLSLPGLYPLERISRAARSGFDQVELWWPFFTADPDTDEILDLAEALQIECVRLICLNIDAGDVEAGDRGLLSDPARRDRCRTSIVAAIQAAAITGCRLLNLPYGNRLPAVTEDEQHRTAWENLEFAAEQARAAGISVLVEPLNAQDNPDYLLPDLASAADLVGRARQAGHPNVGILLDVYHLARTEKTQQDVEAAIVLYAPEVLHVQLADLPDRRCPGTGDLDFTGIQRALATSGYRGFLSLEFAGGPDPDKALREALDFIRP